MIKMKTINVDGVEIIKEVEESLYSQYLKMGWEEVKEEKKSINLSKTKEQPKEKEEKLDGKDI
jgi:hypothetical protein